MLGERPAVLEQASAIPRVDHDLHEELRRGAPSYPPSVKAFGIPLALMRLFSQSSRWTVMPLPIEM